MQNLDPGAGAVLALAYVGELDRGPTLELESGPLHDPDQAPSLSCKPSLSSEAAWNRGLV
jgi:hypothetical protein